MQKPKTPAGKPLKPGEEKILRSLMEGEKTFGELQEDTKLQTNVLSEYLKNLQKNGLIDRDIESRKYRAKVPVTVQILFFNEVLEFVRAQFEKSIKSGNERAGIILGPFGWVVMTGTSDQSKFIEKRLENLENFDALVTVSMMIEDSWEEYYLSAFDKKDHRILKRQKIIETYKQFLRDIFELRYPLELPEKNEKLFADLFEDTQKKMLADYPGIDIPKGMIHLETSRRLKKFAERHAAIMTPTNLGDLYVMLETFEKLKNQNSSCRVLTEKEMQQFEKKMAYLKDSRNKKIYEEQLNRLNDVPRSLIFYPSWGFRGYLQKAKDLIPKQG